MSAASEIEKPAEFWTPENIVNGEKSIDSSRLQTIISFGSSLLEIILFIFCRAGCLSGRPHRYSRKLDQRLCSQAERYSSGLEFGSVVTLNSPSVGNQLFEKGVISEW